MPYIFGKLWHLAIIWAIRKAFQFILQGVRILLANHTRISPTSENDSYHNDNDNEDDDDDESPQGGLLWKSWGLVWYAVTEDATWISKSNISPCSLALSISLENQICCFLFFWNLSVFICHLILLTRDSNELQQNFSKFVFGSSDSHYSSQIILKISLT